MFSFGGISLFCFSLLIVSSFAGLWYTHGGGSRGQIAPLHFDQHGISSQGTARFMKAEYEESI